MIKRFVALLLLALPWWSVAQDVTAGHDRLLCYWDGVRAMTNAERQIQIRARDEIYKRNLSALCDRLSNNRQFSLPRCPQGEPLSTWNDCIGVYQYSTTGRRHVGGFKNGKANGEGVEYDQRGTVTRSGFGRMTGL